MKKKEIVIVFLLIAFGFIYNAVEKGKIKFTDDFSRYFNEKRLVSEQFAEFPYPGRVFPAPKKINVVNPAGEVIINRSDDDQVHFLAFFKVYYSDKAGVDEIAGNALVNAEIENDELNISGGYRSDFPYKRLRIRMELAVPEAVELSVNNQEGNISLRQAGRDVFLMQENGQVLVEGISSALRIEIRGGNLDVKNIAGNVTIDARQCDISLENAAALRLHGKHGNYLLKNVKTHVSIEHAYGDITLDGAGQAEISGRHGKLVVRHIENGIDIRTAFQSILAENIAGDVRMAGRSSRIDIRHVNAKSMVIENSFADIAIADCAGETVNVILKNANLDFSDMHIADRLNIESRQANINLVLGVLADPTFTIKTVRGRIYNQSLTSLEIFQEKDESFANRSGQKPEIVINNRYGDIHIK